MRIDQRWARRALNAIPLSFLAASVSLVGSVAAEPPGQPTLRSGYPPPREPQSIPNDVALVDSDQDGRAEAVRVRLRVTVGAAGVWAITAPQLTPADRNTGSRVVIGGPSGTFPIGPRGPHERNLRVRADKPGPVDVVIEFDAEEIRYFLGGRQSRLEFSVNPTSESGETSRIDGPRYRSAVEPISLDQLGWLPARLLVVEPGLIDGRVGFHVQLEADRDTVAELTLRASLPPRAASAKSTVRIELWAGVNTRDLVLALPPALAHASLDKLELSVTVEPRPASFPSAFWAQHAPRPR